MARIATATGVPWRTVAAILGGLQALGTTAYAAALAVSTRQSSGWMMPGSRQAVAVSLVAEYVLYAAAIATVSLGLAKGRRWAFTPFLVVQAFLVVAVGSTLAQSDNPKYAAAGYGIIAIAVAAAGSAVASQAVRPTSSSVSD